MKPEKIPPQNSVMTNKMTKQRRHNTKRKADKQVRRISKRAIAEGLDS